MSLQKPSIKVVVVAFIRRPILKAMTARAGWNKSGQARPAVEMPFANVPGSIARLGVAADKGFIERVEELVGAGAVRIID